MSADWYEAVSADARLTQGDLVLDCPLVGWRSGGLATAAGSETEVLVAARDVLEADVIVMTQACDLDNDRVKNVVLCPCPPLAEFKEAWREHHEQAKGADWKKLCDSICKGYAWHSAMLNAGDCAALRTTHRVVQFQEVYTVPRDFLEALLARRNITRLRLLSPYREHLSQSFARFFMRVGLPAPVDKAW